MTLLIAKFILVAFVGYLLGSIPFGLIVSKRKANIDIRNYGSGKTGGTNVLRTLGRKAFVLVASLDIAKGALAVVIAGFVVGADDYMAIGSYGYLGVVFAQALAGLAAVIGHIWPIFAKFKGGRGVATFFGGLIALSPFAGLFGGEALIIAAGISGFVSLGSIIGVVGAYTVLIPLVIMYGERLEYLVYALAGTLIIIIVHRDNIKRLLSGKERKLGQKTEKSEPKNLGNSLTNI
jgi:glycerol-3-phosphate acyltransferase PlsY